MKTVYLCPNTGKSAAVELANEIVSLLAHRGLEVYGSDRLCSLIGDKALIPSGGRTDFDLALVLGGDGTILRTAQELAGSGTPILGVNLGRLGYLTEAEPKELREVLDRVLTGNYTVEHRAVLNGVLTIEGENPQSFYAFNDFSLHRGDLGGTLPVRTLINRTYMDIFLADGVIACTPSGSTAYNFSAGGPLVNPLAKNMIFTPICAHMAFSRSIVLMGEDLLTFEIDRSSCSGTPIFSVDGDRHMALEKSARLDITLSDITFPLIRTGNRSFYDILRKKMFG
ncbi:MAG: NAD(+)/NADH kinase [Eubacteriales bacterium]